MRIDCAKVTALIEWVNTTEVGATISSLSDLKDGCIIVKILQLMDPSISDLSPRCNPLKIVYEFLLENFPQDITNLLDEDKFASGDEETIAYVLALILSMSISCDNKETFVAKLVKPSTVSQFNIRHILVEFLKYEKPMYLTDTFFDILNEEAPSAMELSTHDLTTDSINSSLRPQSFVQTPTINDSATSSNIFYTPVKPLFRNVLQDEEIYQHVPKSCPPAQRSGNRHHGYNINDSNLGSYDASPMQDFLTSPAVNYKIKTQHLEHRLSMLERHLALERTSREDAEKLLADKEEALQAMIKRTQSLLLAKENKQEIIEHINENLHSVSMEKVELETQVSRLKQTNRLLSENTKPCDLCKEFEEIVEANQKMKHEISTTSERLKQQSDKLVTVANTKDELQEQCLQQQRTLELLSQQLDKLSNEKQEQDEIHVAKIEELKQALEEKESNVAMAGECMTVVVDTQVAELKEKLHELQTNWTPPDVTNDLKTNLEKSKNQIELLKETETKLMSDIQIVQQNLQQRSEEFIKKSEELVMKTEEFSRNNDELSQRCTAAEKSSQNFEQKLIEVTNIKESAMKKVHQLESSWTPPDVTKDLKANLEESRNQVQILKESQAKLISEKQSIICDLQLKSEESEKKSQEIYKKSEEFLTKNQEFLIRNEELCTRNEELSTNLKEFSKKIKTLLEQCRDSDKQIQNLEQNVSEVTNHKVALENKVQQLQATWTHPDEANDFKANLEESRRQLKVSKENEHNLTSQKQVIEHNLLQRNEELKAKTDELSKVKQELSEQMSNTEHEMQRLEDKLVQFTNERAALYEKVRQLEDTWAPPEAVDDLKSDKEELVKKIGSLKENEVRLMSEKVELENRLKKITEDLDNKTKEFAKLNEELTQKICDTEEVLKILQEKLVEVNNHKDTIEEKLNEVRSSWTSPNDAEELQKKLEGHKNEITTLKENEMKLISEKQQVENNIQQKNEELVGKTEEFTKFREELINRCCNAEKVSENLEEKLTALTNVKVSLEEELQNLKSTWTSPDAANDLRVKLEDTSKQVENLKEVEIKLTSQKQEVENNLHTKCEEFSIKTDEFTKKEQEILERCSCAEKASQNLEEKLSEITNIKVSMEEKLHDLKSTWTPPDVATDLKVKLKETHNQLETLKENEIQLINKKQEVENNLQRKSEEFSKRSDEFTKKEEELMERCSCAEKASQDLEEKLSKITNIKVSLEKKLHNLESTWTLPDVANNLKANLEESMIQVDILKTKEASLITEKADSEKLCKELSVKNEEMLKRCYKAEETSQSLEKRLYEVNNQKESIENNLREFETTWTSPKDAAELETNINKLRCQIEVFKENEIKLTSEKQEAEKDFVKKSEEFSRMNEELVQRCSEAEKSSRCFEDKLTQIANIKLCLENELQQLKDTWTSPDVSKELKTNLEECGIQIEKLKAEEIKLASEKQQIEKDLQAKCADLLMKSAEFSTQQDKLLEQCNIAENASKNLEEKLSEVTKVKMTMDERMHQLETTWTPPDVADDLRSNLEESRKQIEILKASEFKLTSEKQDLETNLQKKSNEFINKSEQPSRKNEEHMLQSEEFFKKSEAFATKIDELLERCSGAEKESLSLQGKLSEVTKVKASLEEKLCTLESSWTSPDAAKDLKTSVEELKEQIEKLKKNEHKLQSENLELENDLQKKRDELNDKTQEFMIKFGDQKSEISELRIDLQEITHELNKSENELKMEIQQKNSFKQQAEEQQTMLQEASNKYLDLKSALLDAQKELATQKQNFKTEIHELKVELSEWEVQYTTMEDKMKDKLNEVLSEEKIKQTKMEKDCALLQNKLLEWQERANSQTLKKDEVMSNYISIKEKFLKLNEEYEKLKKELAATLNKYHQMQQERTQYFLKQSETGKASKHQNAQIRSLEAQLEFANRTISELKKDEDKHKTIMPVFPDIQPHVYEERKKSRRKSLDGSLNANITPGKLYRCRSDDLLSSPMNRQLQIADNNSLNYSVDSPNLSRTNRLPSRRRAQQCISVESSMLDDNMERRIYPEGPTDMNMNIQNPAANISITSIERQIPSEAHNQLAMQTSDEPDALEWGSLGGIAKLQQRNHNKFSHIKTSYSTKGESSSTHMSSRRMTESSNSLKQSIENQNLRRMTINPITGGSMQRGGSSKLRQKLIDPSERKSSGSSDDISGISPMKTRRQKTAHEQRELRKVVKNQEGRSGAVLEHDFDEPIRATGRESVMLQVAITPKHKVRRKSLDSLDRVVTPSQLIRCRSDDSLSSPMHRFSKSESGGNTSAELNDSLNDVLSPTRYFNQSIASTLQTSDEPDDLEWGSLNRIAELQRRNAARLPHLKSSYPVETGGNTPSRSDEIVRMGDADTTIRRMTQTTESLQRSIVNHNQRRMTINPIAGTNAGKKIRRFNRSSNLQNTNVYQKRKSSGSSDDLVSPMKTRRQSSVNAQRELRKAVKNQEWRNATILEQELDRENSDLRRESVMFEITNTPKKSSKKENVKPGSKAGVGTRSTTAKVEPKNSEKRSLMNRMTNSLKLNNRAKR